jgi:Hemolysins and related proteins containing CBS domains
MLAISAFFSGMEIAFLSSNKLRIELDRKQGKAYAAIFDIFLKHPGQFISTLLVGNNIALVVYGIYTTQLINPMLEPHIASDAAILAINTILSTGLILVAGEFLPKAFFRVKANLFLRIFTFPLAALYTIFYPISKFTTWLALAMLRVVGVRINRREAAPIFDTIDLVNLINEAKHHESVEPNHDIKIFQNALDFSQVKVRDRMIPRIDIRALEVSATIEEVKSLFIETNFSRIPIFDGSVDNIIGYVNSKDLFKEPKTVRDMLLPLNFIPETMSAQKLLTRFIKEHKSMAVVVDEFGGTAGLVTIEDIIEEIFGDIEDEHDEKDTIEKRLSEETFLFSGKLKVEDINERYGLDIPESEDYDTIAGFILFYNQSIPAPSDVIVIDRFKIKILRMSSTRIILVHLSIQ